MIDFSNLHGTDIMKCVHLALDTSDLGPNMMKLCLNVQGVQLWPKQFDKTMALF